MKNHFEQSLEPCVSKFQTLAPVTEDQQTIAALMEANEYLGEENSRLRNSNSILRKVVRSLRDTVSILRTANETAVANDEAFKSFCAEPIVTEDFE